MRIRTVLLVVAPAAAVCVAAAGAFASTPPAPLGADYPWAQPGTVLPVTSCTQPPASVPIVSVTTTATVPGCSYEWAQPGTAAVSTVGTQPAWVPVGPGEAGS
jgi:hypothetical protein